MHFCASFPWNVSLFGRGKTAPDGIMVGRIDAAVDGTLVGFQGFADQDIVYAEVEFVLVVGDAQAASRLGERIVQLSGNRAVGV